LAPEPALHWTRRWNCSLRYDGPRGYYRNSLTTASDCGTVAVVRSFRHAHKGNIPVSLRPEHAEGPATMRVIQSVGVAAKHRRRRQPIHDAF